MDLKRLTVQFTIPIQKLTDTLVKNPTSNHRVSTKHFFNQKNYTSNELFKKHPDCVNIYPLY